MYLAFYIIPTYWKIVYFVPSFHIFPIISFFPFLLFTDLFIPLLDHIFVTMSHPPHNPHHTPYPPPQGNVGFEQYQQGAPPPYSGPGPYPQQGYGAPPPGHGPYAPGPYGHGPPGPQYPPGQQPQTVYVYEDKRRQQKQNDEDTCLAMMAGACAMCLCCSLLSD